MCILLEEKERLQYLNISIYFFPTLIPYLVLASEQHYFEKIENKFL
jgi:hypothetical protein